MDESIEVYRLRQTKKSGEYREIRLRSDRHMLARNGISVDGKIVPTQWVEIGRLRSGESLEKIRDVYLKMRYVLLIGGEN